MREDTMPMPTSLPQPLRAGPCYARRRRWRLFLATACAVWLATGCAALPPAEVPPSPGQRGQAVVLDIDGTLTPHNLHFMEVRPGAPQVLQAYAGKGYGIVYITTRVRPLQAGLQGWLASNGFPAGALHVPQSEAERGDAAGFKAGVLARYRAAGWRLAYAYGDSPTDFAAYARAGVPPTQVFALKRRYATACAGEPYAACLDGWVEHLHYVQQEVPPSQ